MSGAAPGLLRRNPAFRRLWSASSVSMLGDRFSLFAVPALALTRLHAAPAQVALLFAVQALPGAVLAFPAAAHLVGRSERGAMMTADVVRAAVLGLAVGLALAGRLTLWVLFACVVIIGVANTLFDIASQAYFPRIVSAADYAEGNTRLVQASSTAAVAGPLLTGILIGGAGPVWAIGVDALSFVASCGLLARIGGLSPAAQSADAGADHRGLRASLVTGWRLVAGHPGLRAIIVAGTLFNLGGAVISSLWFSYLLRGLRLAPAVVGVLATAGGVSALVTTLAASWILRRISTQLALTVSLVTAVAAIWLIPLSARGHPVLLLTAYQLVFSSAAVIFGIVSATVRQSIVPQEYQGRVFAVVYTFAMASLPLGGALGSAVVTATSPVFGLVFGAGIVTVSVLSVRALAHAATPAMQPAPGKTRFKRSKESIS